RPLSTSHRLAPARAWPARHRALTAPFPKGERDSHFTEPSRRTSSLMHSGLTVSPWANTASPAANTLCAALMSRSWSALHCRQDQCRTLNGSFGNTCPQTWQRLLDGYQRSTRTNSRPYQRALYSSCLTNSAHPASPIDLARQRFFRMLDTDKLSTAITWFS